MTAAFLVDASRSGEPAGTVRRFDAGAMALPATLRLSSHGLGLAEAIELARTLGRLPPSCIVYAIEGRSFAIGTALSAPVATATADVAARLCAEIGAGSENAG